MAESSGRPHILVVEGRFYEDIADELAKGAEAELQRSEASFERVSTPGVFEIPAAVHMGVRSLDFHAAGQRFDGFIALGCVIRGETSHYDYICGESARKLQDLACRYLLALGYGILTCETKEQAWARARLEGGDKGGAAGRACLEMIEIKRRFQLFPR